MGDCTRCCCGLVDDVVVVLVVAIEDDDGGGDAVGLLRFDFAPPLPALYTLVLL